MTVVFERRNSQEIATIEQSDGSSDDLWDSTASRLFGGMPLMLREAADYTAEFRDRPLADPTRRASSDPETLLLFVFYCSIFAPHSCVRVIR